MPATCYRCAYENEYPPGDPFGVCQECSIMACQSCGNRVPGRSRFVCLICFPESVLLPDAGLPRFREGPPGGGGHLRDPDLPDDGGGGEAVEPVFASSAEFETLMPLLAEETQANREQFRGAGMRAILQLGRDYSFDEATRHQINERIGYTEVVDEVEEERRREALNGARRLLRDVDAARANEIFRPDLLADAFGLASWAIGVPPGSVVPLERLVLLDDLRLRFVLGYASPATMVTVA
ncbi:MAG TPA: hypothetical protein VFJ64_12460 [Solirubrobacterales bacterium]|nr:hypothetical protein [Solirubrobacterales bacterium]